MTYNTNTFPLLVHEVDCVDADIITCSTCNSAYRFSLKAATGPGVAYLLYCRFTNTIYTVNSWAEMNPEFKAEMDKLIHSASDVIFRPTSVGETYSTLEELAKAHEEIFSGRREARRLIEDCPYCGTFIPNENWKKTDGLSKVPWIELAPHFWAKPNEKSSSFAFDMPSPQEIRKMEKVAQMNKRRMYGKHEVIKRPWWKNLFSK